MRRSQVVAISFLEARDNGALGEDLDTIRRLHDVPPELKYCRMTMDAYMEATQFTFSDKPFRGKKT